MAHHCGTQGSTCRSRPVGCGFHVRHETIVRRWVLPFKQSRAQTVRVHAILATDKRRQPGGHEGQDTALHATAEQSQTTQDAESLRSLRVVDLQKLLQQAGLPKTGLKEQLVQRLLPVLQHSNHQNGESSKVKGHGEDAGSSVPDTKQGKTKAAAAAAAANDGTSAARSSRTASSGSTQVPAALTAETAQTGSHLETDVNLTPTAEDSGGSRAVGTSYREPASQADVRSTRSSSSSARAVPTNGFSNSSISAGSSSSSEVTGFNATGTQPGSRALASVIGRNDRGPVEAAGGRRAPALSSQRQQAPAGPAAAAEVPPRASAAATDVPGRSAPAARVVAAAEYAPGRSAAASAPPPHGTAYAESAGRRPWDDEHGRPVQVFGQQQQQRWQQNPRSSYPQELLSNSWAGHRAPRYSCKGRGRVSFGAWQQPAAAGQALEPGVAAAMAAAAAVASRSFVTSSAEEESPDGEVYPFLVDEHGQVVGKSTTPVSRWPQQAPPLHFPPRAQLCRGESFGSNKLPMTYEDKQNFLVSNPTKLSITFLGTSSNQATQHRAQPSVALMRGKDVIFFDTGDDTQRQLNGMSHVRTGKVFRIFITCMSADCLLGLPGLLCTISASRERGHETADIPVHLYGPPGLMDYISTVLKVSNTYLEISIIVHEFTMSAVPPEHAQPRLVNARAKLWLVLMPPDQLNPTGYINGDLSSFMPNRGRATMKKGMSACGGVLRFDPRAGFLPMPEPTPGDPSRTDVAPLDMRWTIKMDTEGYVTAFPLQAPRATLGYALTEADRVGNFILENLEALRVPKGPALGQLKDGKPIVTHEGTLVTPEMVITPWKPGRKVVLLGTCTDASCLLRQPDAYGADVLIAGCLRPTVKLTDEVLATVPGIAELLPAVSLGNIVAQLGVRHTLLGRFDWRLHGTTTHPYEDPVVKTLIRRVAERISPMQRVTAVHDFWVHVLDKHEGREWGEAVGNATAEEDGFGTSCFE